MSPLLELPQSTPDHPVTSPQPVKGINYLPTETLTEIHEQIIIITYLSSELNELPVFLNVLPSDCLRKRPSNLHFLLQLVPQFSIV